MEALQVPRKYSAKAVDSALPKLTHPVGKLKAHDLLRRVGLEPVWESGLRRYWKLDGVPKSEEQVKQGMVDRGNP